MDEIAQVSEYEFRRYRVKFEGPFGALIIAEKEWYACASPPVLGVILLDRVDGDWGFVVLMRDESDDFTAVDTGASYPDMESARQALKDAMKRSAVM